MLERNVGGDQRMLERERAADRERHEIVAPQRGDVGGLLIVGTVAVDAVQRHIGADIDVDAEIAEDRIARFGDVDQRTGLAVQRAELQEVIGPVARQDHDIGLDIASGEPAGMAAITAGADQRAQRGGVFWQQSVGLLEGQVHGRRRGVVHASATCAVARCATILDAAPTHCPTKLLDAAR